MTTPRLGAHMSVSGGPANAFVRGRSIGCETMQIFVRSPNRWNSPPLTNDQVQAYYQEQESTDIWPVVAHSSYLINLGSPDRALWTRSLETLIDELQRCRRLGIDTYVLHPGSHRGSGEKEGLRRVVDGLDQALANCGDGESPVIALETTAGQGDSLGCSFEQLAWLIAHCNHAQRLGVCLDTAHVLVAGYEFRTPKTYQALWQAFDALIGRERLRVIHLNDSKRDLGSQVDRHEHIGEGFVGEQAFRLLLNDPSLRHIPMVLETPKGADMREDIENLARLRRLINADG
ncbi:MAG: deoxyribonuclease IV [Chloroflexi bacterium]|nr:deoxyribonuclease IV [Chloroflexota bacterium]